MSDSDSILDNVARMGPPTAKFLGQIAPSVIATLIAAGLISGYNHAFSSHVQQPRMAALKTETDAIPVVDQGPQVTVVSKPVPAAEYFASRERAIEPPRVLDKEAGAEAGKDQSATKTADLAPVPAAAPVPQTAPAPQATVPAPQAAPQASRPTNVANPVPRPAPRAVERHPEPRVASVPYVVPPAAPAPVVTVAPMAPPVAVAPTPLPPVASAPPPVILAPPPVASAQQPYTTQQPTVTVPDRTYQRVPYDPNQRAYDPNQQRPYEQHAEEMAPPPPQPQGAIGVIVNTLKPSTWFARAREFGDRIEQAGNDILPNIRPQ